MKQSDLIEFSNRGVKWTHPIDDDDLRAKFEAETGMKAPRKGSRPGDSIHRLRLSVSALVLAVLLLSLVILTGCATNPTARWAQARESVTTAQDVTVGLHQAEVIDDADLKAVAPWIIAARNQVNAAYVYLPDGGPTYDKLLATVAEYVARVRARLREANP